MSASTGKELDRRFELFEAFILAVATVLTAWSAFQSTKWSGEQADGYSVAAASRTLASRSTTAAGLQTTVDVQTFLQWLQAVNNERAAGAQPIAPEGGYVPDPTKLSGFLYERFRPEFVAAFDAWVATRPLTNPAAPGTPFEMPEYRLAATAEADRLDSAADEAAVRARAANERGDSYVMVTVLFASVLFFAGISSKMDTLRARLFLIGAALVTLTGGAIVLATFPVKI